MQVASQVLAAMCWLGCHMQLHSTSSDRQHSSTALQCNGTQHHMPALGCDHNS